MSYTSFEGFDGNPRKKETWLMLKQAYEERGIQIARPEKYSIVQEKMFLQMKNGIDSLPEYKWQDGDIVKATHNYDTDYEFKRIAHGAALGKEQQLQYFALACKNELCERTIKKYNTFTNAYYNFLMATHNDSYERVFIKHPQTYTISNSYCIPLDFYVVWEYTYSYYLYQRPTALSSPQLTYKEEDQPYRGRGVNDMLPHQPYFLGRVDESENITVSFEVADGGGIYTDAAQYMEPEDFMTLRKFEFHARPTFYLDFDFVMK